MPLTIGPSNGMFVAAASSNVNVRLVTGLELIVGTSDMRSRAAPFGFTSNTSTSAERVWLKPVRVTFTSVTTPVKPETLIVEGYNEAGSDTVVTSLIVMLVELLNAVAGEPLVVTVNPHPPAKLPAFVSVSSAIYKLQFPFGSAPLKTLAKVPAPSLKG